MIELRMLSDALSPFSDLQYREYIPVTFLAQYMRGLFSTCQA